MATYHRIQEGECLSSIANQFGYADYHAIYDHPKNALLKKTRPNPNVLFPGDCIYIPDKQEKQEARGTTRQHVFQIGAPTVLLRLRLLDDEDKPYAGKRYAVKIDDRILRGSTSAQGWVEQSVPADAEQAELMLWLDEEAADDIYRTDLAIGHLDPAEEIAGVQARLSNLGFSCGSIDGIMGPKTELALKRFQRKAGLDPTGKIDAQTRNRLRERHDTD